MYLTWLVLVNVFLFFSFRHSYKDLNVELNFKVQCEKRNRNYRNRFTPSAWIWFLVSIKHIKTWKIKSIWRMDGLVFASSETNKTGVTVESTSSPHDREKPNTFRPQVETRKLLGKVLHDMLCLHILTGAHKNGQRKRKRRKKRLFLR